MTGQGPWGPEQYDPRQHQQRIGQPPQQYPPQGQPWPQQGYQPPGWQQPGYGPQSPWGPQQYGPGQNQRGLQQPPAQYSSQGYGQVQAYALAQPPRPGWSPYAQPQYALPPVAPKSTAAGLILGLLWPGVGCMYAGRVGIGILLMGIWLISIPLVFVLGLGFITGFCVWVASAILGYTMTREWNSAHGIVSLSAGREHLPQIHPDGLEEPVRDVAAEVVERNPLHGLHLAGAGYARRPCNHLTRHVYEMCARVRMDPFAEYPHRPDGEANLLEDLARGLVGALARLGLAAGQDPRRSGVVRAAAHQQDAAALPGDDRDRGYPASGRAGDGDNRPVIRPDRE